MATHSSILAWEIPWTDEPGDGGGGGGGAGEVCSIHGVIKSQTQLSTHTHTHTHTHTRGGSQLLSCIMILCLWPQMIRPRNGRYLTQVSQLDSLSQGSENRRG